MSPSALTKTTEVIMSKLLKSKLFKECMSAVDSFMPHGVEHLAQLLWLQTHPPDWTHWWSKTALIKSKVNPS